MGMFDFILGKKPRKQRQTKGRSEKASRPESAPKAYAGPQRGSAASPVPDRQPENNSDNIPMTYVTPVTSTQQEVLDYLNNNPQGITFIHGKAGCGKTYLINKIESANRGCQVLTPTNLAATLYRRARTLHSFFWKGFDKLEEGYQNTANITPAKASSMSYELSKITMLVFDEISMVRADTFEMMNRICQKAKRNSLPFGGIPVVVVGDLFQPSSDC